MPPTATSTSRPNLFEDVGKKVEKLSLDQHDATDSSEETAEADGDGQRMLDEIESLCMNCQEDGTTRLLLTRIPYFKEIILMSFYCPHCHFRNNDIQSAGQIQQQGCKYVFEISDMESLSRQIVRSDTAVVRVRELDLEIPPGQGQLTNIEGLLRGIVDGLTQQAQVVELPEYRDILDSVRLKGEQMLNGEAFPFTLEIDDPAGNSFIEPSATLEAGGKYVRSDYDRTPQQNEELSLTDTTNDAKDVNHLPSDATGKSISINDDISPDEVYSFPASCPGCTRPCVTNMKMVEIPHFKSVIIMSTICESCGYRSNDVKTGGEVPDKGRRITLAVEAAEDLSRDVLKSESCHLSSPELTLSVQPGTLGGRFTTVEGLLTQIRDDLRSNIYDMDGRPHTSTPGDSLDEGTKSKWGIFFTSLDLAIKAEKKFTIILEDPLAASYVQSLTAPDPDPQLTIESYDRTDEEEEDLGLKDMKVEGYEEGPQDKEEQVENPSN
ncbi:MAG: nucleolar zinc-finger protein [Geoglossum umbratile]|nr:MAG: nucleolar zinc-finger protein [Geoglossum umbratile]